MENFVPLRRLFRLFRSILTRYHVMFTKLSVTAALSAAIALTSSFAHGQFGGVQVQVGGYGTGVRIGNFGYGNGYGSSYYNGYGNGYGNSYYNGYGNGFGNQYYGNYGSRYGNFGNYGNAYSNNYGNNGYGYGYVPNAGYAVQSPRYYSVPSRNYSVPSRSYTVRRYRYR